MPLVRSASPGPRASGEPPRGRSVSAVVTPAESRACSVHRCESPARATGARSAAFIRRDHRMSMIAAVATPEFAPDVAAPAGPGAPAPWRPEIQREPAPAPAHPLSPRTAIALLVAMALAAVLLVGVTVRIAGRGLAATTAAPLVPSGRLIVPAPAVAGGLPRRYRPLINALNLGEIAQFRQRFIAPFGADAGLYAAGLYVHVPRRQLPLEPRRSGHRRLPAAGQPGGHLGSYLAGSRRARRWHGPMRRRGDRRYSGLGLRLGDRASGGCSDVAGPRHKRGPARGTPAEDARQPSGRLRLATAVL